MLIVLDAEELEDLINFVSIEMPIDKSEWEIRPFALGFGAECQRLQTASELSWEFEIADMVIIEDGVVDDDNKAARAPLKVGIENVVEF